MALGASRLPYRDDPLFKVTFPEKMRNVNHDRSVDEPIVPLTANPFATVTITGPMTLTSLPLLMVIFWKLYTLDVCPPATPIVKPEPVLIAKLPYVPGGMAK